MKKESKKRKKAKRLIQERTKPLGGIYYDSKSYREWLFIKRTLRPHELNPSPADVDIMDWMKDTASMCRTQPFLSHKGERLWTYNDIVEEMYEQRLINDHYRDKLLSFLSGPLRDLGITIIENDHRIKKINKKHDNPNREREEIPLKDGSVVHRTKRYLLDQPVLHGGRLEVSDDKRY